MKSQISRQRPRMTYVIRSAADLVMEFKGEGFVPAEGIS
jgi:hypothetical protein